MKARRRAAARASPKRPPRLRNLGPKSRQWLRAVGVDTLGDLQTVGALEAYRRVRASRPGVTVVLLYALAGALLDCHWNDLPPGLKDELRAAAEAD